MSWDGRFPEKKLFFKLKTLREGKVNIVAGIFPLI